jgi:hypothetical protein
MPANSDSSCVETLYNLGAIKRLRLLATFDTGDGSFTSHALTNPIDGYIVKVTTTPAGTPSANYDISLTDVNSVDVLQALCQNRHTSNVETVRIVYSGKEEHPCVAQSDALTLVISGNSDTSCTSTIDIYFTTCV